MMSNNNGERTPLLLNTSSSGRNNNNVGMRGRHHSINNNNNVSMMSSDNVSSGYSRSSHREFDSSVIPNPHNNNNNNNNHRSSSSSSGVGDENPRQQQQQGVDSSSLLDINDIHDNDKDVRRGGFLHRTWRQIRMHGERLHQRSISILGVTGSTTDAAEHQHDLNLNLYGNVDSSFRNNISMTTGNSTHDATYNNDNQENNENDTTSDNLLIGIVANGDDYYEDTFHDDEPHQCSFGTREDNGIWLVNFKNDRGGILMAGTVWLLIFYSAFTMILLSCSNHLRVTITTVYCTICCLALTCHVKTMLTNPGAVPSCALPIISANKSVKYHAMCSVCQSYKPAYTHHCRICNRCIVRMDHHCPWMNNCIGVNNLKHFILFLIYTWIGSVLALIIFAVNYFFCNSSECQFNDNAVEISLVRVMTLICIVTVLFTSSMLMNVIYGITTGIGTIDRLKKKADDQWHLAMEEPIPLRDIVGISTSRITVAGGEQVVIARLADWWWWFVPVDPQFDDYDRVMGYATAVRLLREQQQQQRQQSSPLSSSRRFPISTTTTGATTCITVATSAPLLSQTTMSSASSSGPLGVTQASV